MTQIVFVLVARSTNGDDLPRSHDTPYGSVHPYVSTSDPSLFRPSNGASLVARILQCLANQFRQVTQVLESLTAIATIVSHYRFVRMVLTMNVFYSTVPFTENDNTSTSCRYDYIFHLFVNVLPQRTII